MTIAENFGPAPTMSLGARISDRLNPILVKEVRQALRGRFFKVSFWVTLTMATIVGLFVLLISYSNSGTNNEDVFGVQFFTAIFSCLSLASLVLVPFSAFLSMGAEWDENTYDLLVISNLKPRQIILGKVLSASVQSLLFYSAFGPFLVFAFLLRGVDLFALATVLSISVTGSLSLSCLAVAMSSFARGRFARLLLMVLLAVILVVSTMVMIAFGAQMIRRPGQFHDSDAILGLAAGLSVVLATAAFFFAAACARLAHPEENRSTGLRVMTLVGIAIGLGWLTGLNGYSYYKYTAFTGVAVSHSALAIFSLFYMTEPERLGRRVARGLPKSSLLRLLYMPFLPGGARGLLFHILVSALLFAWVILYGLIVEGPTAFGSGELGVPIAITLYGLIYLGLPSAIFSWRSDKLVTRSIARIVTLAVFLAGLLVPAILGFMLGFDRWANFEHPLNVFLAIDDLVDGDGKIKGIWGFLIGGSLLSVALNLPRLIRALREMFAPRASA